MAAGTSSDFTFYDEQFWAGFTETIVENTNVFNAASRNAIRLVPRNIMGDYNKRQYLNQVSMINRRDTTSVSSTADTATSSDEIIGVKLHRRIGPIGHTESALRNIGEDSEGYSRLVGEQAAAEMQQEMLARAFAAVGNALGQQSSLLYDASDGTLQVEDLTQGMQLMGDQASRLICWVMTPQAYFALMRDHITNAIDSVAGVTIMEGANPTFGKPVILSDSASLTVSGSPDNYWTFGLVENGVVITQSEEQTILAERVSGLENIVYRIQGEYAYNLELKGLKWDTTNGGANPSNAAVATGTNWDASATSYKDMVGVRIVSQ